jgi:regulator of protease activity HflC (stomatin/prohibitin superfamily)
MKVMDPIKASYGIKNFRYATIQLAQTMMRSVIGQLELDKTFEEREQMNASIVVQLDEATDPWGVQVTRYEIQNITVPRTILQTMELQVKAERDKRAAIARSIGEMESKHQLLHRYHGRSHQQVGRGNATEDQRGRGAGGGNPSHRQGKRRQHRKNRRGL